MQEYGGGWVQLQAGTTRHQHEDMDVLAFQLALQEAVRHSFGIVSQVCRLVGSLAAL